VRVAVTGGAGYIGSVVCEELAAEGHAVLVIDNLSKGHADAIPESALFVQADLLDGDRIAGALRAFGATAVVHMAAHSLVGESMLDPGKYYRNNVTAGLSLLDAMRAADVSRLVFSSTAAVYGDPVKQPIEESDAKTPTNPYGETKLTFERALHWYAQLHGISSVSLRYFNAAGATARSGERHTPETHLIPLVLEAAAGRLPQVTIYGDDYATNDGTCIRDYIHVSDLARAHVLALSALVRPGLCEAYNLGCGGTGYSVREVIDTAAHVTGRRIPVVVAPRRPGDPPVLIASSDRIRAELGWRPRSQDLGTIIGSAWAWLEGRSRRSVA
jgi:UDP-glucose 4-epimerase